MPAPTIRDVQSNGNGTGSVVVTNPALAGDRVFAFVQMRDIGSTLTVPAGWTIESDVVSVGDPQLRAAIVTKDDPESSSPPGSYTFSNDGTGIGMAASIVAVELAGGFGTISLVADETEDTDCESPSITPAGVESLIVRGFVHERSVFGITPYISPPSGYTEEDEFRNSTNRLSIQVSSKVSGSTDPTGIESADVWANSDHTGAHTMYGIGGVVELLIDPTAYIDARLELGLASDGVLFTTTPIDARLELGLDVDPDMELSLDARLELGADLFGDIFITHTIQARLELGMDAHADIALEHFLTARLELGLGAQEDPLGPGYGLVTPKRSAGGGAGTGAGFDMSYDPTAELREGDEFLVFLPGHGLSGVVGLARVIRRSASDEDRRQRMDLIQFTPIDDETYIPRLAGGDQIRVRIQESVQHSLNRFRRRVQRDRRRR